MTDHPELVTNRWHLVLNELLAPDDRIQICNGNCERDHALPGTTFFLPWAREASDLRRELGASSLTDPEIAALTDQLHEASASALMFLERTQHLLVESPGRNSRVSRARVADRIRITLNDEPSEWFLLQGEAPGAAALKQEYDPDSGRSSMVQVAVPLADSVVGRIYADLPTETRTGWNGHINGTFFPRQDRKTVEFDGRGFRGKWNDLLVDAAGVLVAESLEAIATELGHEVAWKYLVDAEQINRDIEKDEYPKVFAGFFLGAKALAPKAAIALLADESTVTPPGTVVPRDEMEYDAVDVLLRLGVKAVSRSIRPHARQISLTQYGMHQLGVADVVEALISADVTTAWSPGSAGEPIVESEVEPLLRLLDHLQQRGKNLLADAGVGQVAIVPCVDGSFAPADEVSNLEDDDRALFELLSPDLRILDRGRLESLCPGLIALCDDITPARAIEIFEADPDALAVAPDLVLEWLANHRGALASEDIKARVRSLPIFPSKGGELRPLTELSLSSDFDDVLGVADIVDREKTAGHTDLLRLMGARELDALEYLVRHVAPVAEAHTLTANQALDVLEIVHRHRLELDHSPAARDVLRRAPLVPCVDGQRRSAAEVHLPNRALTLIAPETPIAATAGMGGHLIGTLVWLGASEQPSDAVLNQAAVRLGEQEEVPNPEVVLAILNALPNPPGSDAPPPSLRHLGSSAWLPCEGGTRGRPEEVFAIFQRYLFESQGKKLALPREDQQRLTKVLDWLGVQSTPSTAMVVAHLRHCAKTATKMNPEVYRALGQAKEESLVRALTNESCIQIADGEFVGPSVAYWSDPGLGPWAHVLPAGNRDFQAFFDRVGVSDAPTPAQVEETLRRIGRAAGNDRLDDDTKAVVHRCWELLDQHLQDADEVLARLRAVKSAVGPRDLLEKPELLLFADGRRLAETILLIKDNLIRRDRTTHRALSTAGVRAAEEVITAHVDAEIPFSTAETLTRLLRERMPALERLAEAQRAEGAEYDLQSLLDVRIDLMPDLTFEYVTRFAHQHQVDPSRPADAIYFPDENRLVVRSEVPNRHLAREISLCVAPDVDVSSLAPSLLEVLGAASLTEAMTVLDEYGVRDLDESTWEQVASQRSDDFEVDDSEDHEPRGADQDAAEDPDAFGASDEGAARDKGDQHEGSSEGDGSRESGRERKKGRKRAGSGQRRTEMASFVSFDDDDRVLDAHGDEAPERSAVDAAGVRRVLAYERSCGRIPEEQVHNNPGFDVLSKDADGIVVRRIEIKSIGGAWTGFGVWMSATQMEENRTYADDFWLYVVEHAEDDDAAVIHRIHNPAGEATKFGFNTGWQALREPDIERDDSGRALVSSTRRLLGGGSASAPPPTE